mmetsp:Transcript_75404/g.121720  ORF Transcript_75404/g.121720 Transcript_75404/m.121720 type:complete len:458 (-) Transcript_75404:103-1476(-)|eukprot:CAMPEP_0115077570 /NCGR_PEP_ID=MMETSP0227-20121206/17067_1 /TAXON_ID=89957 /ORGANISM="Polarella glacialis, Strain CCMP 1383" /LENGTH=457 /DNA_ID=CAMNT_0002464859 /DNA_START=145 /DNA_END=1518 /DNA_ORIENTATION=+
MDRSVLGCRLRDRGFQVVEPLKCAGHAAIFRVRDRIDDDTESFVAKVVCLTGLDAQGQAGAQQEVSLLKGLSAHPNLIAYRESFLEEAGILFIVMSLAEDGDLRRVVTEAQAVKRVLPEPVVLSWLRQVLLGLEHLHKQGVVHRDLKSSNIFLCGGRRHIRIGDFGISTVLQSTAFASSCVGTPAYMSPELMRNERYDYHVDMWALGCICFELCTLSMPFPASSLLQLAVQVMETEPAWSLISGRSEDIQEVNRCLLRKDVAARPTASATLRQPLFAEGGRAALGASEEEWASLAERESENSPDKRRLDTTFSTMAASGTGTDSLSSKGDGWVMTPRMPWETSSRASENSMGRSPGGLGSTTGSWSVSETAPAVPSGKKSMDHEFQRARDAKHEFSKAEFADVLSTHQEQLLSSLRAGTVGQSGGRTGGYGVQPLPAHQHDQSPRMDRQRPVSETVV